MSKDKDHNDKNGRKYNDDRGRGDDHDSGYKGKDDRHYESGHGDKDDDRDHGHDDGHEGKDKIHVVAGTQGNDILPGTDGKDLIIGKGGDDHIDGGAGNDILLGGKGNDFVFGGAGNDLVFGGKGNDQVDGGAGSDWVLGGKGDDLANYTLSENVGAHDFYDGGKGFDTLQLTLTWAELHLASVQADIAAFEVFLAHKANPHDDDGRTFQFQSFDLDVRNFERLDIVLINTPPAAHDDTYRLDEDTVLLVAAPGVVANDTDVEGSALSAILVAGPTHGTLTLGADGSLEYRPAHDFNGSDSFTYKVNDGDLDSNVATVTLEIAPVNDPPMAANDAATTDEDTPVVLDILANDSDVDGDRLSAVIVDGPVNGKLSPNADGSFTYTPNANFFGDDAFTYRASDGSLESGLATVSLTINSVNDVPVAYADAFATDEDTATSGNVLANDTDVEDGRPGTVSAVNGDPANVGVALVLASGALLTINADGSFSYDPNGQFEALSDNSLVFDGFTYVAQDADGANSNTAAVSIAIFGVNDAPVAHDDVIPGTGGGAVRVAVVGGSTSTYIDAAAQLNTHNPGLAIVATAMLVNPSATKADWAATFAAYDVVVIGENGTTTFDYDGSQIFAALRDFVNAGGGVVTTGWFAGKIAAYSDPAVGADADYVSPAAPWPDSPYVASGTAITVSDPANPIAGGITGYSAQGLHEVAGATDASATVLATDPGGHAAIAYDEVMLGRTVFLGSLHMATAAFNPDATRTGPVDQIFEQAVVWAAGDQGSGATTDEDTIYVIDGALLLANDTDVEGDTLSIFSVAATSLLGATLSLNAAGDVVYDPTVGLQYLAAGQIETDSFEYTVSDGHGGFGTANVALTVSGKNNAPDAVNDARITNEDTAISGNVLTNDTDAEGDALVVTTPGALTSALGAAVTLDAAGAYTYDPTVSAALQALSAGTSKVDSFSYSISDGKGGTDTAAVNITVIGLNEAGSSGGSGQILSSVSPATELEYYIRFDDGSPEWLRLEGFSMDLSNSGSTSGGGGGSAGKVTASDVHSLLGSSQTLVELTAALASGQHLKDVEIEAYRPGGDKGGQLVDQFYFADVLVNSLQTSGSASSTANDVSFDFAKFDHGHIEYTDKGTALPATEAGFDFLKNVDFTGGPAVAGDALKAKLDDALPTDVQLKYYVTYEGAGGWLELDSFSMGLSSSATIGGSGGGGAGKVSASDVVLALGSSAQILDLTDGVTSGQHFKFLEIEAYAPGGEKGNSLVDQYYFADVLVTGLSTANATSNQVSLDYGKFSHGHVDYKADGTQGDITSAGWDFIANKEFTAPVDADLF